MGLGTPPFHYGLQIPEQPLIHHSTAPKPSVLFFEVALVWLGAVGPQQTISEAEALADFTEGRGFHIIQRQDLATPSVKSSCLLIQYWSLMSVGRQMGRKGGYKVREA